MDGVGRRVGIEKLAAYPTTGALDIAELCRVRGFSADGFLVEQRSVNPPWEDAVTMAVNAATPMLSEEDRKSIGLLVVGTESAVDQEKPLSSWVHHFLGLPRDCWHVELKHACFAATGGLQLATNWLASGLNRGKKALVVSSDLSLIGLDLSYEAVGGAGAAAALLSEEPALAEFELGRLGTHAFESTDVSRPTPRVERADGQLSLFCYLECLEESFARYAERYPEANEYTKYFAHNLYHSPFPGITRLAHVEMLSRLEGRSKREALADFEARVLPALTFNRRTGATYGASTFVELLGLTAGTRPIHEGDRVGVYSYGAGSCAHFYSMKLLANARAIAQAAGMQELIDARRNLTVAEYEACEKERDAAVGASEYRPNLEALDGWFDRRYKGSGLLMLESVENYRRVYRRA